MEKVPTDKELGKIKQMAHLCFGHLLNISKIIDIWRLANGRVVLKEKYPKAVDMQAMAKMYLELRPYWEL